MADVVGTVTFVDLAGFTALTDRHGDADAVDLVFRFEAMARAEVGDGELVKTIGDAVMLHHPRPLGAVDSVCRLARAAAAVDGFPRLRAGMHHGPLVAKRGDLYGGTVNLASRLAGIAWPGQLAVTGTVASASRAAGRAVESVGTHRLRNISDPVEVFVVPLGPGPDRPVDPVCQMTLGTDPVGPSAAAGRAWWFCSHACRDAFESDPGRFLP